MGAACSGTSLAILDAAIAAEVVMVSPSNTSPQFTKMDKKGDFTQELLLPIFYKVKY